MIDPVTGNIDTVLMNGKEEKAEVEDFKVTYLTQFTGELLNMALLDSGCTQSVCGKMWLDAYRQTLPMDVNKSIVTESSKRTFRFGDGELVSSIGRIVVPIYLNGVRKTIGLETDIVDKDLPLLMSRGSMKRADTTIAFSKNGEEEVTMFGKRQKLYISSSGHLCIPLKVMSVECYSQGEWIN